MNFVRRLIAFNYFKTFNRNSRFSSAATNPQEYCVSEKNNKEEIIEVLVKLLRIRKFLAVSLTEKYKNLLQADANLIVNNYNICKQNGIKNESIVKYPYILGEKRLEDKIVLINHLDLNTYLPLLNIKLSSFIQLQNKTDPSLVDSIQCLSRLLQQPNDVVCEYVSKRPFLMRKDLTKLKETVELLEDYGISKQEILRDLHVLQYTCKTIKFRLDLAREFKVEKIKSWMVRAPSPIIESYIKRRSENKLILGNNSLIEYLAQRLDCSVDHVKFFLSKHPAIENQSLKKTEEMIDFLYSQGFKPFHICRLPKILLHSVETTKKRLKELSDQGLQLDSLYVLTKSQKQYLEFYENLMKTKRK